MSKNRMKTKKKGVIVSNLIEKPPLSYHEAVLLELKKMDRHLISAVLKDSKIKKFEYELSIKDYELKSTKDLKLNDIAKFVENYLLNMGFKKAKCKKDNISYYVYNVTIWMEI